MSTILLDFDGTLTDSAPGILASYRTMLRALGHEPDPTIDLGFVIGPAWTTSCRWCWRPMAIRGCRRR